MPSFLTNHIKGDVTRPEAFGTGLSVAVLHGVVVVDIVFSHSIALFALNKPINIDLHNAPSVAAYLAAYSVAGFATTNTVFRLQDWGVHVFAPIHSSLCVETYLDQSVDLF